MAFAQGGCLLASWPLSRRWRDLAKQPEGLVFPSENGKPLWVCNVLVRSLKPKARELGIGQVNFQVLRRFQTSEGRRAGIDDKVAADQRGHTVGVALETYARSAVIEKRRAVQTLESHILRGNAILPRRFELCSKAVRPMFGRARKLLILERETGLEPATSSLGN
jgi:hypothetical protein